MGVNPGPVAYARCPSTHPLNCLFSLVQTEVERLQLLDASDGQQQQRVTDTRRLYTSYKDKMPTSELNTPFPLRNPPVVEGFLLYPASGPTELLFLEPPSSSLGNRDIVRKLSVELHPAVLDIKEVRHAISSALHPANRFLALSTYNVIPRFVRVNRSWIQ